MVAQAGERDSAFKAQRRTTRRAVSFDPEIAPQVQEAEEDGPRLLKIGRAVVLEPSRSSMELAHLRGEDATVLSVTVDGDVPIYSVQVRSTGETVQVPGYWVRPEGLVIAGSSAVDFLSLEEVLQQASQLRAPVFQRRYCWGRAEWSELWESVLETLQDGRNRRQPERSQSHSLGRLLFFSEGDGTLVLDGQQRLTTTCVLLATLADRLRALGNSGAAAQLSSLLVNDEGQYRFVPTLDDRQDFGSCLMDPVPLGDGALIEAKHFFADLAARLSLADCVRFADALRSRMMVLSFFLRDRESLQSVFENLTEQQRVGPGVALTSLDLVRNFVFEHFADEGQMREAHALYWSPMEKHATGPDGLSNVFCAFLRCTDKELCGSFLDWWNGNESAVTAEAAIARLQLLMATVVKPNPGSMP